MNQLTKKIINEFSPMWTNKQVWEFDQLNPELTFDTLLKKYKGSVFNTAGDSVLAEFPSAVNAVECGVDFQNEIKKRN